MTIHRLWLLLALLVLGGCDIVVGVHELDPERVICERPSDCPGPSTPCSERICTDHACGFERAVEGKPCLAGTCDGEGTCIGYEDCEVHAQCPPHRQLCDQRVNLCVACLDDSDCKPRGEVGCFLGQCTCFASHLTFCAGSCRDVSNDPDHCGGCFNTCATGACLDGNCF